MVTMIQEIKKMYKGKKVFLTGHTGFKGSWMLEVFTLLGAQVKGYSLEPKSKNDLFFLINGNDICESIIADIRDAKRLTKEIIEFQPDFIFHLAAQPLVRESYIIPAETFEVNVLGTANILDAVRQLEKKCSIVVITTDKVYQNNEWDYPYRENDRLGGLDPYSASKACTELVVHSYRNSYFHPDNFLKHFKSIAVGRSGNVIGGGDWSKDRLIPDIVKAFSKDEPVTVRNPKSIRPWQHVLEPIVGYLILGSKLEEDPGRYCQAYNFGPYLTDTLTVAEMVKLSIKSWGNGEYVEEQMLNDYHEAGLLKLDISKTNSDLKWYPKTNAIIAVSLTIDWYKEFYLSRANIENFTTNQILDFINE